MNRKIISILATAAFAVLPTMAFASTSITNLTFDGNPNIPNGVAGQSSDATLWVTLSSNSDAVESVSYEFPGSGLPYQCVAINPADVQAGQYSIDLNNTDGSNPGFILPNEAGSWPVLVKTFKATTPFPNVNVGCTGSPDATRTFHSVVNVENSNVNTSNSNSTTNTSLNNVNSSLQTLVNTLTAEVNALLHPTTTPAIVTTSSTSGTCAQLAGAMIGTQMNVYNNANQVLQGFLLFQHESIPALAAGASFGYFGPQTQAALTSFKAQYGCM